MKWISLLILLFSTTAIANETLMSWDFEVIQVDGTIHSGTLHLNREGDVIGTLYNEESKEFVQAYGWHIDEDEEQVSSLQLEL